MGNSKVELNVISLLSELSSLFKNIRHHYCKQVSWHWPLSMFVNIQCSGCMLPQLRLSNRSLTTSLSYEK